MTIRIIGVGFGRTGTSSLQAALQQLGFAPCYHFGEVFAHPEHKEHWLAAARGEREAWRRALDGYRATVDWPGTAFWRELVDAYPNAKVILTTRDADRWFESIDQTIFATMRAGQLRGGSAEQSGSPDTARRMGELVQVMGREVLAARSFAGTVDDRNHVLACYRRHNEEVRRQVPAERLLDYRVSQGWEPLCRFVGVPVPDAPFPHLNDRTTLLGNGRAGTGRAA